MQKHAFWRGSRHTFIISRTFTRWRYSLCNAFFAERERWNEVVLGVGWVCDAEGALLAYYIIYVILCEISS